MSSRVQHAIAAGVGFYATIQASASHDEVAAVLFLFATIWFTAKVIKP